MNTRKIGNLEVSSIGMGCMGFSHGHGAVPDEAYSIEAIQKAYDFGCTFFDTAESYGTEMFYPGHNEQLVGKAIEEFRKDIVLATKFHVEEADGQEGSTLYADIRRHLEESMKNLRTDYIDLYYLHRINEQVPFSPIGSGFLSGKVTTETKFEGDDVRKFVVQLSKDNIVANQPTLDVIQDWAERKHTIMAQISLAWMLQKYPNVVPIPRFQNQERILENLSAWNITLNEEEFAALDTAQNHCTVYGHRGHVESDQTNFGKHWAKK